MLIGLSEPGVLFMAKESNSFLQWMISQVNVHLYAQEMMLPHILYPST